MTLAQAHDIADLAAPVPSQAAKALRTLRQALEDGERNRQQLLETFMLLLIQLRAAAGVPNDLQLADLPAAIETLRRNAFPAHVTATMAARAVELVPSSERHGGIDHYAKCWLTAWQQVVRESQS